MAWFNCLHIVIKYSNLNRECFVAWSNTLYWKTFYEDFNELARLLNEKDKQIKELISDKNIQFQKMQKQIDKLINKLQIQNINNGTVNNGNIINNNTMNIKIFHYKVFIDYIFDTERLLLLFRIAIIA